MANPPSPEIHPALITTLQAVPGYTIARPVGIVTCIGTGSGKTAQGKARSAFLEARDGLSTEAAAMGANAIVGLTQSVFGTSIGGAFGDAVGVSLIGTAVVLELGT